MPEVEAVPELLMVLVLPSAEMPAKLLPDVETVPEFLMVLVLPVASTAFVVVAMEPVEVTVRLSLPFITLPALPFVTVVGVETV